MAEDNNLLEAAGHRLGAPVVEATPLAGGHTPARLTRLRLAGGRTAVLKAAPPADPDDLIDWGAVLRDELPAYRDSRLARWRPGFLGEFELGGWQCLLLEDLSRATRVPPWDEAALEAVAEGLAGMHSATVEEEPGGRLRWGHQLTAVHDRGPL